MKDVVDNAREVYDIKGYIIKVFWESQKEELKGIGEFQQSGFDWMFKKSIVKKNWRILVQTLIELRIL